MKFFLKLDPDRWSLRNKSLLILFFISLTALMFTSCNKSPEVSTQATTSHADHSATAASHTDHSAAAEAAPTPRVPAFFMSTAEAKPLPPVLDPAQFNDPVISKAYRYAQENPELYAQQPCYCYCDSGFGHRSLLDCYASDHSVGCALCLKEGLLVHKLHQEGKSATDIRDLIVRGEWKTVKLE